MLMPAMYVVMTGKPSLVNAP